MIIKIKIKIKTIKIFKIMMIMQMIFSKINRKLMNILKMKIKCTNPINEF